MLQEEKEIIEEIVEEKVIANSSGSCSCRRRGPLLMLIGLGILAGVLAVQITEYTNEKALLSTMEQLLLEDVQVSSGEAAQDPALGEVPEMTQDHTVQDPDQFNLLGRMKIPSIDLEVPIVEGSDRNALRSAVGHMSQTALPGSGNCVIAGHRNYSFGRFFNRLNEVVEGDEIEIVTSSGEQYLYQVSRISVVEPDEVSVLEPSQDATLTLITCTPIYIASHRLIVEAKLIKF